MSGRLTPILVHAVLAMAMSRAATAQIYVDAPEVEKPRPEDIRFGLELFAADSISFDDNLFRLPAGYLSVANGPGKFSRSDRVNGQSVAGGDRWVIGLQDVAVELRLNHYNFADNSDLDNTGGSGRADWIWNLSSQLSGELSADHAKSLASFENTRIFNKDELDTSAYLASARFQVGPVWALTAEARRAETRHGLESQQPANSNVTSGAVGVGYATSSDNSLEVQYQYESGQFPNTTISPTSIGNDFRQSTARLLFHYEPSDRTSVDANGGYVVRSYTDTRLSKFAGDVWHASIKWEAGQTTKIAALASRDLTAYTSTASEYFIDEGVAISATWTPRDTLSVAFLASHDRQNYVPGSGQTISGSNRRDTVGAEKVTVNYMPRDWLNFDVFCNWQRRDSNSSFFSYSDRVVVAEFRVVFAGPR